MTSRGIECRCTGRPVPQSHGRWFVQKSLPGQVDIKHRAARSNTVRENACDDRRGIRSGAVAATAVDERARQYCQDYERAPAQSYQSHPPIRITGIPELSAAGSRASGMTRTKIPRARPPAKQPEIDNIPVRGPSTRIQTSHDWLVRRTSREEWANEAGLQFQIDVTARTGRASTCTWRAPILFNKFCSSGAVTSTSNSI